MPSRYEAPVDRNAANNAHAYMLDMTGWNRTVLELGAAAGHMTRALNDQDCRVTAIEYDPAATVDLKQFADEVIVGDLNDPNIFSGIPTRFDVVLAGDVLEHLINPHQVLSRASRLLLPGGKIVVSLPNIGHVDVRLSLLQGRFDYTPNGLLDATHLRFFTIKTIEELVCRSGLVMTDLKRVRIPAFETEQALERSSVSTAVLEAALADPEAETYQFVFTAVKSDGNHQTLRQAQRNVDLQDQVSRLRQSIRALEATLESNEIEATSRIDELRNALRAEARGRSAAEAEIAALNRTKTLRYTKLLRDGYRRLLRHHEPMG